MPKHSTSTPSVRTEDTSNSQKSVVSATDSAPKQGVKFPEWHPVSDEPPLDTWINITFKDQTLIATTWGGELSLIHI